NSSATFFTRMVVTKPILGWSFSALDTVDGEIFNRFAISLIVAGFPSFISYPFLWSVPTIVGACNIRIIGRRKAQSKNVPARVPRVYGKRTSLYVRGGPASGLSDRPAFRKGGCGHSSVGFGCRTRTSRWRHSTMLRLSYLPGHRQNLWSGR